MNIMVYIYLFTCLCYAYVGMVTYIYDSKNKLNRIFFILCLDLALWALMLTLVNAVPDAETATVFRRIATIFWSAIFCLLLHFIIILIKKDMILKKPLVSVLFYSPALISVYLYYLHMPATVQDIVKLPYGWAYLNPIGKGFLWDNYLSIYSAFYTVTSILLLYIWGKQSVFRREKRQSGIIISTIAAIFPLGAVTDIILPIMGIPLIPTLTIFFILIPIFGIWYSIKKYRLMNLSPENVFLDVMKTVREGVIITNPDRVIQDINIGVEKLLGYTEDELKNRPIDVILREKSALQGVDIYNPKDLILITKNNEELPVLFSSSTLSDEWGEPYGSVFTFQDLTEIKRMQSKLLRSYEELEMKVLERTLELNTANKELKNEISARIEMENEIKKLALYDHLTGLPNRRLFNDYLNQKIHENLRNEIPLSVMFLDLDSFKMINDTMGHDQGDELIKQVASRLAGTLRVNDIIGRIGGDEFLIIVHNTPDEKTSEIVAGKLIECFRHPFILDRNEIYITASIGIAMYPVDGEDVDTLIKNADIAMYRAKEKGKNKYEICTSTMKNSLVETMKLTNRLYRTIERKELDLYYQPQVDADSGRIVGFEALIRWNHPEMGVVLPGEFISLAEKTGLIIPIGEWVLETACRQNKLWQDQGMITVPVAVNLSAKQFMDRGIVDKISGVLGKTGLEPRFLELEITENVLMNEVDLISDTMEKLNKLGINISIDDFGTEYFSLNYLKQLSIDRLKIAMTFVQGIMINQKDEAIINTIIALADNLRIRTIAEGVETLDQLEFLRKVKCDVVQGFYLYKPMSAAQIEELLREQM